MYFSPFFSVGNASDSCFFVRICFCFCSCSSSSSSPAIGSYATIWSLMDFRGSIFLSSFSTTGGCDGGGREEGGGAAVVADGSVVAFSVGGASISSFFFEEKKSLKSPHVLIKSTCERRKRTNERGYAFIGDGSISSSGVVISCISRFKESLSLSFSRRSFLLSFEKIRAREGRDTLTLSLSPSLFVCMSLS